MLQRQSAFFFAAILAATAPGVVRAQQVTGSITGTVVEQSGSAVPSASVTLTNQETGVARQLKTDPQGEFVFTALPPAIYKVEAGSGGFKRLVRPDIVLPPNERLSLGKLQLELGLVSEAVTVRA